MLWKLGGTTKITIEELIWNLWHQEITRKLSFHPNVPSKNFQILQPNIQYSHRLEAKRLVTTLQSISDQLFNREFADPPTFQSSLTGIASVNR